MVFARGAKKKAIGPTSQNRCSISFLSSRDVYSTTDNSVHLHDNAYV